MTFEKLEQYLLARIDELTTIDVYNSKIPIDKDYPCVNFMLGSSSNPVRLRDDYILTLDFWANSENSITIVQQADLIKAGLNYYYQSESGGFYQSHLIFFARIPDEKPNVRRIQQRYLLKVR